VLAHVCAVGIEESHLQGDRAAGVEAELKGGGGDHRKEAEVTRAKAASQRLWWDEEVGGERSVELHARV
jgi:hypothetical protein